jgi:hypothetical protein
MVLDAPICFDACGSALMLTDDSVDWRVAYGSPVDGELQALASVGGGFQALLTTRPALPEQGDSLVAWSSEDGTDWVRQDAQPTLPAAVTWLDDVAVAVADDRLVVTAWGQLAPDGDNVSIALLGPRWRQLTDRG